VRVAYVDTSALGRILLNEPDKAAIELAFEGIDEVVSSRLLWIELRRLARRCEVRTAAAGEPQQVSQLAEELLRPIAAIPLEESLLANAEVIRPTSVAALDAIHLATAVHLAEVSPLDVIVTYDRRLAEGAREHGLKVLAPV
jgi:predicted nucleic acid-binding protein